MADNMDEIKAAVRSVLSELESLPSCKIEGARVKQIEDLTIKLSTLITGNGNPENGLVMKVDRVATDLRNHKEKTETEFTAIKDVLKLRSNREWGILAAVLVAVVLQVIQLI